MIIPGSGGFEYVCPGIRVEEFCVKRGRKIRVFKAWWVVFAHELNIFLYRGGPPPVPKPLAKPPKARDGEHSPVDKNPELRLVVPLRQRSGVQTGPVCCVACVTFPRQHEDNDKQQRRNACRSHCVIVVHAPDMETRILSIQSSVSGVLTIRHAPYT